MNIIAFRRLCTPLLGWLALGSLPAVTSAAAAPATTAPIHRYMTSTGTRARHAEHPGLEPSLSPASGGALLVDAGHQPFHRR